MMKQKSILLSLLLITTIFSGNPKPTAAGFYPNVSSIPTSLLPNTTAWESFAKLAGCKKGEKTAGLARLKSYFHYFGYLDAGPNTNLTDEYFDGGLESAVRAYQFNFNLNSTGQLDVPTLNRIVQPRCGNPDVVNGTSTMRGGGRSASSTINGTVAHYSFFPNRPRWPAGRNPLTYAFAPENQLSDRVRGVFARAFERWSEVSTLSFVETTTYNRADIRIGFFTGDHGDGEPFDGVLGTLAHAFSPPAGRCHLDGDESWVVDGDFIGGSTPFSAVDLESVAVHEIGHLLGLGHSSVEEAIMYPTISTGSRKVELANDDILGIQELYGSNPNYNGSGPALVPRDERDSSGAGRCWSAGRIHLIGLLLFYFFILLFV